VTLLAIRDRVLRRNCRVRVSYSPRKVQGMLLALALCGIAVLRVGVMTLSHSVGVRPEAAKRNGRLWVMPPRRFVAFRAPLLTYFFFELRSVGFAWRPRTTASQRVIERGPQRMFRTPAECSAGEATSSCVVDPKRRGGTRRATGARTITRLPVRELPLVRVRGSRHNAQRESSGTVRRAEIRR
jgi:hypothetical protein